MSWYLFDQNNSGGRFVVNDKVCHRLFIEAESAEDAIDKAEDLGCYWDGVEYGLDCPCCGDRWSRCDDPVNIERYKTEGYQASVLFISRNDYKDEWWRRYGEFDVIKEPEVVEDYPYKYYNGKIRFNNIEEYAQYLANEYGFTTPDARIYYANGDVKEIFTKRGRDATTS